MKMIKGFLNFLDDTDRFLNEHCERIFVLILMMIILVVSTLIGCGLFKLLFS